MADLGNLMFRMGLNTKDFEKQMQDELALAKKTAEEIKKAFADIKLPTTGGKDGKGGGAGGGVDNDELKTTDDLYKKLANRIGIVNEQMAKLRINAKYGYNGQYVQDAIDKLDVFKEKLTSGLLSGSKSVAQNTMKLFSNQDYALLNKQVENLIREGDKYNRSLDQQAAAQKKALEEQERQKVTMGSLVGQYNKLADAINKVNFAQNHTNKSGVSAGGALTNNARTGLLNAQNEITRLINLMSTGGNVSRSQIQTAMEGATRAIRESSTAIQQQRAINTESQRQQMQGQAQILARQRAINAAQAENARLIARSNSHFSIMRNLVGQVGSMMGMYFGVYALQNFIQDLVRIRGEFDMQYTALKAILQSGQQASELFSQLKTLAPISPYQFKDLATYAKQLSAYSIPYNELFDTTKRLADLSSGLGVDFYRIVLAYGQVRSAAVLRGCLGYDTDIVMYDGSKKKVQDVVVGDLLRGDDDKPRVVKELIRGNEQMYKVSGDGYSYRVNQNHILTLYSKPLSRVVDVCVWGYLVNEEDYLGVRYVNGEFITYPISVTEDVIDDYCGFVIDQDKRFLIGDNVVTHNTELRQFTEAGIPMVDELAKKFTKLKGEVVSAGDVFELISERQVPFQMVKEVIDDLTNEGGKFYMMQEKQSETLKGKVSNLADRYDIMMNSLGEANDGVLKGTVDAMAAIMEHANLLVNAISKLAAIWGAWKIGVLMQTTAMGRNIEVMNAEGVVQQRNVSAVIRETEARKQKQATLLREAVLYRKLSGEEIKYMASAGVSSGMFGGRWGQKAKLDSKDYTKLVQKGSISQNEALRLAYMGKIDRKGLDILRTNQLITKQQYQQVLHAREMAVSWLPRQLQREGVINTLTKARLVLYRTMGSIMQGLGAMFNPTTLAIAGISAAITAAFEYKAQRDKMDKDAAQIAQNAKENYEDIRKFIADNPIEIAIKSGDDASMRETVKRYVEEIQKAVPSPLANNLISSIYADSNGKERGLQDQVNRAKELAEAISLATQWQSEYNRLLIDAADKENGWFSDSLQTNMKDAATEFQEFRTALYGIDKVKILNTLQNEGLDKMGEEGKLLARQLADGKSSMEAIFSTVSKMYAKSEQYNKSQGGVDNVYHFDRFLDNSGLRNVLDQYYGSFGTEGYASAASDMTAQVKQVAENLKNAMKDAGINPMTDAGRIYAEQLKKSFFENAEISDEHIQNLFSFTFDSTLYGTQATAFKMLGTELVGALSDGARQAVQDFKEKGEWSMAMEAAVNEAKEKVISKHPEPKDELEKAWQAPNLQILIRTELGAQQLEAWKKYMMDVLGDKYYIAIKMTTNVKEAQEAIQKVYDDARAFITKQKPLQVKLGVAWSTEGIKGWLNKNQDKGDQTTVALMKNVLKAFETVDEGKAGVDKGWISTDKSDKKDKPKGGSQKDKYTDDLKRRYESFKKAIQEYNKAIKSMGEAEAKALVKTVYGIELPDKYIDKYGTITLAEDFQKKNTKNTDTAKNFRETLRNDKASATVQKQTDSYDALAEAQMETIKLTEKQYKDYDELFKKTGNAQLSSILAFSSETKPYKDVVEYLKNELVQMGKNLKVEGISFDKLMGLSPQEIDNLQPKIKELFTKIKEAIATDGADVKKQLEEVFNKTSDLDIKLVINENLRKNLIENLPKVYKDASPEDIKKMTDAINDYYNKAAADIKLEQFKRNINWELIFSDIENKSKKMLRVIRGQLDKFIKSPAYKEVAGKDPKSARELVNKRDELDQAIESKSLNLNIFKAFSDFQKAQTYLENALSDQSRIENDPKSTKEQKATASQTVQMAQANFNKAQTQLDGTQRKLMSVINTMTQLGSTSEKSMVQTGTAITELMSALGVIPSKVATIIQGILAILDGIGKQGLFNFVGNILGSVFEAIGGIFDGIGDIFGISGLGGIFHTKSETQEEYEEEKERHQELRKVWDTVIERIKEALNEGGSENYSSKAEDIKNIYEKERNAAKELGKQYLNAGASSGFLGIGSSASHGVEQRDGMTTKAWKELCSWARSDYGKGVDLSSIANGRMTGLFDLSVEQLKTLQEQAPYFWASLHEETRTYLEEMIEAGEKIEDLEDEIKELYTDTTTDAIADSFASALDSMDDQTKTFADNFTKTLRNAIINAYVNSKAMKNKIQSFYDKMAEFAENDEYGANDSIYSSREWIELKGLWQGLTDDATAFQSALKQLGAYADQTSGSVSGSIKSITEETADLLASYVNAIRADVAFIRAWYVAHFDDDNSNSDTITNISVAVANIEANTRRSADNTDELVDLINAVTKTTTNGKAVRVA